MSTGDELDAPGGTPGLGTIPDSNLVMLTALVAQWGGEVALAVRVPDDPDALRSVMARAVASADLVVTSGGISAGAFEVVRQSLESPTVRFVQVAMQPGKPQGLGTLPGGPRGDVVLIALPGNPVSSFVSFHVFVRPALERLAGRDPAAATARVRVRAAEAWPSPSGRRQYVPVRLDGAGEPYEARLAHRLGSASHLVGSLHVAHAPWPSSLHTSRRSRWVSRYLPSPSVHSHPAEVAQRADPPRGTGRPAAARPPAAPGLRVPLRPRAPTQPRAPARGPSPRRGRG